VNKKLCITVVPLLATIAFAMAPTSALAVEPTWFSNGAQIPESAGEVTGVTWGDLSLKGAAEINCHNDIGGTVENKTVGGVLKAFDKIYDFSAFLCTSPSISCPLGLVVAVEPRNLPWAGEIVTIAGKVRDNITGVRVKLGCRRAGAVMGTASGEGEVIGTNFVIGPGQKQAPLAPFGALKGTSALNPGKHSYDAGSGELEAEGSGGTAKGITEGEVKGFGYNEQELVQLK
jgi:hypothetical protein